MLIDNNRFRSVESLKIIQPPFVSSTPVNAAVNRLPVESLPIVNSEIENNAPLSTQQCKITKNSINEVGNLPLLEIAEESFP